MHNLCFLFHECENTAIIRNSQNREIVILYNTIGIKNDQVVFREQQLSQKPFYTVEHWLSDLVMFRPLEYETARREMTKL